VDPDFTNRADIADLLGIPRPRTSVCLYPIYRSRVEIPEALLALATQWAQDRSKDPRTKVGAVVYDYETGASFMGYNGFNSGMPDFQVVWDNRERGTPNNKYRFVRHAEANAIEKATKLLGHLHGRNTVLVLTHYPCPDCMTDHIIPAGIKVVFFAEHHDANPTTATLAAIHGIALNQLTPPRTATEQA